MRKNNVSANFSAKFKPPNVKLWSAALKPESKKDRGHIRSKCSGTDIGTQRDYVDLFEFPVLNSNAWVCGQRKHA